MSNVNINFNPNGQQLNSYIEQLQRRVAGLQEQSLRNTRAQSTSAQEQLRLYRDQITALERRSRIEGKEGNISSRMDRRDRDRDIRAEFDEEKAKLDDLNSRGRLRRKTYNSRVNDLEERRDSQLEQSSSQYRQDIEAIRERGREDDLIVASLRETIDSIRESSAQLLTEMRAGRDDIVDSIDSENDPTMDLAARLAAEEREREKRNGERGEDDNKKRGGDQSIVSSILSALAIERAAGLAAGIPSAKNELDAIKPMAAVIGMVAGGLAGTLIDIVTGTQFLGVGLGQTQFGQLGSQIGEKLGEFGGGAVERTYKGRDDLTIANYRLQALTGNNYGIDAFGVGKNGGTGLSSITKDLKEYGLSYKQTAELQHSVAKAQGSSNNLGRNSENVIALEKAYDVAQNTSTQMIELLRSTQGRNTDVLGLISGTLQRGSGDIFSHDKTFLEEFMSKNFAGLQKTLLSTQNTVGTGTTVDLLRMFDSIGGPFSARDYRSGGLINTIQGSLASPDSDNLKALSFIALRRQNPKMGLASVLEEQQKGLASPEYLKSMLGMIDQIGGSRDMKILNTAQMLGLKDNIGAARLIYENRGGIMNGSISAGDLMGTGQYGEGAVRGLAASQVSSYSVGTAEIENAFVRGAVEGVTVATERMGALLEDSVKGMEVYLKELLDKKLAELRAASNSSLTNSIPSPIKAAVKSTAMSGGSLTAGATAGILDALNYFKGK